MSESATIHGTFVSLGEDGALLRGASGAGKSDLALRFLFTSCMLLGGAPALIADDYVTVTREGGGLIGTCPPPLQGKMEVRGLGVIEAPAVRPAARLCLLVDLVDEFAVPRFPEALESEPVLGIPIAKVSLFPFEASAAIKLALWLQRYRQVDKD